MQSNRITYFSMLRHQHFWSFTLDSVWDERWIEKSVRGRSKWSPSSAKLEASSIAHRPWSPFKCCHASFVLHGKGGKKSRWWFRLQNIYKKVMKNTWKLHPVPGRKFGGWCFSKFPLMARGLSSSSFFLTTHQIWTSNDIWTQPDNRCDFYIHVWSRVLLLCSPKLDANQPNVHRSPRPTFRW